MKKLTVSLSALVVAAFAPLAHAELQLTYQVDGGAVVNCGTSPNPDPSQSCTNTTVDGLLIQGLNGTSNSPGSSTISYDTSATSTLSNTGSTDATIVINLMVDGFTTPTAPPGAIIFISNVGGSVEVGKASNTLSYDSCIGGNNLNGCAGSTIFAPVSSPSVTATGSYNDSQQSVVTSLSAPYSINETLTIVLDPGAIVNFSAGSTLSQAEPASVILMGSLLVVLRS